MSNPAISFVPFKDANTFQESMKYLELTDIPNAARVCKSWNTLIQTSTIIWKNIFEKEGVPQVSCSADKPRNHREDFKVLYPRTISSRIIGEYIGKVVGKVPPISEECFNRLQEEDPFEKGKLIRENYIFVVVPALIQRTVDKEKTPLALNESGNLVLFKQEKQPAEPQELMIPLSLKNLVVLCTYALKGKENGPVFNECSSVDAVFNQCSICADKISVYLMRKHIAKLSKGLSYPEQQILVKMENMEVTPLRERALFNVIEILRSGTCPDNSNPCTYARNTDTVHIVDNGLFQTAIGGFNPGAGIIVSRSHISASFMGIAPGLSIEIHKS